MIFDSYFKNIAIKDYFYFKDFLKQKTDYLKSEFFRVLIDCVEDKKWQNTLIN